MNCTVTLTERELCMLIDAANIMHFRYGKPEMRESVRLAAQEYADLCSKLYNALLDHYDRQKEETHG